MSVVRRTESADGDLRQIAYYIAVESGRPVIADAVIDEILDCCNRLAETSSTARIGTNASELGPGVRIFSCRRWAIIFRYTDDGILVLRIADGSQDYFTWKFIEGT